MREGDVTATHPAVVNSLTPYQAALWYREQGLCPIPWIARDGRKIAVPSKFTYDEYTNPDSGHVDHWLSEWPYHPEWQVGIACAPRAGVFAVDIDDPLQLAQWEDEYGELPVDTWIQSTGRAGGGEHRFFRLADVKSFPRQGALHRKYPKLEVRSASLVAVAPSVHPNGRKYQWDADTPPRLAEPSLLLSAYFASRAVQPRRNEASDAYGARTRPDGSKGYSYSYRNDDLLTDGVPAGCSQHEALRDLVWDMVSRGFSDVEARVMWNAVVARTPLARPDQPWEDKHFEQHLQGARDKLGAGISPRLMKWAHQVSNAPPEEVEKADETVPSAAKPQHPLAPLAWDELTAYEASQSGMARLFVDRYRDSIRWCEDDMSFYTWGDGSDKPATHWHRNSLKGSNGVLIAMVDKVGDLVRDCIKRRVATADPTTIEGKQLIQTAKSYRGPFTTYDGKRAIGKNVLAITDIWASSAEFGTKPHLLNFANGTYDVRTGELRDHDRWDMNTGTIARPLRLELAQKELKESAPVFSKALWRMCAAPGEIDYNKHLDRYTAVRRWLGYGLHGANPEKKMAIFEGATNIGKNQVMEAVQSILGQDIADEFKAQLLVKSRNERHDSVSFNLPGKRMVIVNEFTEGQIIDSHQLLTLVNPDSKLIVRGMRENERRITTTWSITVTTNITASIDMSAELQGRLILMKLSNVSVPREEWFDVKGAILRDEPDAVLAHLVTWWREWWTARESGDRNALAIPDEAVQALEDYGRSNSSPFQDFIEERCTLEEGSYVTSAQLWRYAQAYWNDQHPDKRLEYSGGRQRLYRLVEAMPGVRRHERGNKHNLIGYFGVRHLGYQERQDADAAPDVMPTWLNQQEQRPSTIQDHLIE